MLQFNSGFTIAETPKCGSRWIRRQVKLFDIPCHIAIGKQHSPVESGPDTYALVRHPVSWVRSMWRYQHGIQECSSPDDPHAMFYPIADDFQQFVKDIIDADGIVGRFFDVMVADHKPIRQECLEVGFSRVLAKYGATEYIAPDLFRWSALENVSRDHGEQWNRDMFEVFCRTERYAIERWYG